MAQKLVPFPCHSERGTGCLLSLWARQAMGEEVPRHLTSSLEPRVCKQRGPLKQDCACLRLTGHFSLQPQVFPSEAGLGPLPVLQEDAMHYG